MHDSGFKRWVVLGVLASASWWVAACGALPQQPGNDSFHPGFVRNPAQAGYNGTIQDIPTSIDPRTPEKDGTPGRSLLMDSGERALLEARGLGGSGSAPPASGPEGGPLYDGLGVEGGIIAPSNELPAAQSVGNDRPTNPNAPGGAPARRDARGR
ncbi:hypothetical protein [Archangium sp.]|uniref:hypothetical protein n=1 Tax=Archangium sp. TaxID=1872627 RepID=UPI002D7536A5|nr:hypothetical protein [Archangium sp.]HYO58603.1 hypothetical protein [Archangium sp.]